MAGFIFYGDTCWQIFSNILSRILYQTVAVGKCTIHADSCGLKIRKYIPENVKWNYLINFELAINHLWVRICREMSVKSLERC